MAPNADAIRNQQAMCEHKWDDVSGWGGCASGTHQCRRCNKVLSAAAWADMHRRVRRSGGESP